jgi:hypothetical protein
LRDQLRALGEPAPRRAGLGGLAGARGHLQDPADGLGPEPTSLDRLLTGGVDERRYLRRWRSSSAAKKNRAERRRNSWLSPATEQVNAAGSFPRVRGIPGGMDEMSSGWYDDVADDVPLEANPDDVAEDLADDLLGPPDLPDEADPADVWEQAAEVNLDDVEIDRG